MEEKDVQVRCSIDYEELEDGNFCHYKFAVPVEDLQDGYTIGNNHSFRCTINDELKFINIVALEVSTVREVEFEGHEEPVLCMVYFFIGMHPMTPDEFEDFKKEVEEQRQKYEEEMAKQKEESEVEDVEIVEEEKTILDLTRKDK